MNRFIISILAGCISIASFAMDKNLERINAIKKSNDFLYGEATMTQQEDAISLA